MQLPSFESVSKCSLAETSPLRCIVRGMKDRARGLFVFRRETPRRDHNFSRGDFIYRNVVDPRDDTTWTANFRRPRFPRCRTSKTMLAKRQHLRDALDVMRLGSFAVPQILSRETCRMISTTITCNAVSGQTSRIFLSESSNY